MIGNGHFSVAAGLKTGNFGDTTCGAYGSWQLSSSTYLFMNPMMYWSGHILWWLVHSIH